MKIFTKPLRNAARDSVVGSVIGVVGLCLAVLLIYLVLRLVGYEYKFDGYIPHVVVVAAIISAVGTTANAYRDRKLKKKEQIQKIITENRAKWLGETREVMADLYAAEKTFLSKLSDKKLVKEIDAKVSQLVLSLPYDADVFCDEIYCLADDVKAADVTDTEAVSRLLGRIRTQEKMCRKILKDVWKNIKDEAQAGIEE
ncbi:MAG: hypothetical protein K6F01_10025 [Selenomonas sp.]|uniref:hypothetical protein n=1 Tax=Selenomonas sp. TaxID=2053611 RepID=UPI0025DE7092|nr:hypothetical protein [Selenomonas sp.]MCR5439751.1 hypothetical protein [Selenomonas sp.]